MAKNKQKQKVTKIKKKKWVPVYAPKIFNNAFLGETHVSEDEQVTKKSVGLNLGTVLGDMRKQAYFATFEIISLKEGKAQAALVGVRMTPSGTKRLIRRGRTKIEDSFLARLKNKEVVRVKPLVVTINTCSKNTQTAVRMSIRAKVKELLADASFDSFANEVISNKIQRVLKGVAGEHHPVRTADIKALMLLPKSRGSLASSQEIADEEPADEKTKESSDAPKKAAKKAVKKTVEKTEE